MTSAAMTGRTSRSFVLGVKTSRFLTRLYQIDQIANPNPSTKDSALLISMRKLTPFGVNL